MSFNCSSTCDGLYADVQWVGEELDEETEDESEDILAEMEFKGMEGEQLLRKMYKRIVELERKAELKKGGSAEELDREKFRMMVKEYKEFKKKNMKHFRFTSGANSSSFGEI